jgi:hypothetical protein
MESDEKWIHNPSWKRLSHFGDLLTDVGIILKITLKKYDVASIKLAHLGTSGGIL